MKIRTYLATAAAVAALAVGMSANAAVTLLANQTAFNAAGPASQNTNWDSYGSGFFYPGNPFTVGDLTFVEGGQNLIGGVGTSYGLARNLFTDNYVRGTTIQVAGSHNLFAFNLGNFFSSGAANVNVATNLGSYTFSPSVGTAQSSGALTFFGAQASAGEYFTSVSYSGGNATGATDVQLGAAAVPEPASWALMISGFGMAGAMIRRRKTVAA